ncbi:hypothetical protein HK096_000855 [Nowakowskiella sp. JEL0078]|nr:hypothetical protein HK096_000855 [Nowakowskiella sp. JEL0078]
MPRSCPTYMLAWAPGISTVDLPSEAGFPIGKDSVNWVALQVHYNNPNLDAGVVDSSGMQITYTAQLRPNDMGVFTLGSTDVMIPPKKAWSTNPSLCSSDCTSRFKGNITLVGSFMHMHLLGYAINTKHIRAGAELPNVGSLQYYDFNHQGLQQVGLDTNTLVPGDWLITTCSYRGSNTTIYWGEASSSEMCFNFITYYPKQNTDPQICISDRLSYKGVTDTCTDWGKFTSRMLNATAS